MCTLRGGVELLRGLGFKETPEGEEAFLVLSREAAADLGGLIAARELLVEGQAVQLELHRDPRVLLPGAAAAEHLALPPSFFQPTAEEVKAEAARKAAHVDDLTTLKTQEMRKREAVSAPSSVPGMRDAGEVVQDGRRSRYKYAIMRVRFPTDVQLQGVFRASDSVADLTAFVRAHLETDWALFRLKTPAGERSSPYSWG